MWVRVLAALLEDLFGPAAMSGSSQAPVAPVPSNPRVLFRPPAVRCLYPHRGMHAYTYAKTKGKRGLIGWGKEKGEMDRGRQ